MAKVRRKNDNNIKKPYDDGWWVSPDYVDDDSRGWYEWKTLRNNGDGECIFRLETSIDVQLEVNVDIWDAYEWTDKEQYAPGDVLGRIAISLIAEDATELEAFLLSTESELYRHLRLKPERWFADDIYAGPDSNLIIRHLNMDIDDKEHPAFKAVWHMVEWLMIRLRGQKTAISHTQL
jgi:hypothetical protein